MGQSPVIPRPVSMVLVAVILLISKFLPIWPARVGVTSKRAKIIKLELYSSLLSTETNHANAATTWMFPVRRRPVLTGKVVAILPLVLLHSQYLPVGWGTAGVIGENYQQVKDITNYNYYTALCSSQTCECWKEEEVECKLNSPKCKGGKCYPEGIYPGKNWKKNGWCNK